MSEPTLSETIDSFCTALGITGYEFHPLLGPGYRVIVWFKCDTCLAKWKHKTTRGPETTVRDVIVELMDASDAHRCDLVLGAAGRAAP